MVAVFLKIGKTAFGIFKAASRTGVLLQPADQRSGYLSVAVTDFFLSRACVCMCACARVRACVF